VSRVRARTAPVTDPPAHHGWFRVALIACLAVGLAFTVWAVVDDWAQVRTWPAHLEQSIVSILRGRS
jgi:hypothetical protein